MRVDTAPFNDVRVRQAIRLCMDRKQAVETALFGQGVSGLRLLRPLRPVGRHEPPARTRTSSRRSACSKAAGKQNLKVELVTSPISAGIVEACQVLAQNAKAAGIEITLRKVDVSTYFGGYGKWPFAVDYWVGLPYLVMASLNDGPGANVVNTTHFNDPAFNKLFNEAAKTLDKDKRARSSRDAEDPVRARRQPHLVVPEHDRRIFEEGRRLPEGRRDGLGARALPAPSCTSVDRRRG